MRVFVAGAAGMIGRFLIPALIAEGHEVTGTTRSAGNADKISSLGATPVIADGLDRTAMINAVKAAKPEVVIHEMTALTNLKGFRQFDREFAVTNELRTKGTDYLLEAAEQAGAKRFIAQSYTNWPNERTGGPVKTEDDPLDPAPPRNARQSMAAIRHVESVVMAHGGFVLRYGGFYGHGASGDLLARPLAGEMGVSMMTDIRGSSNAKAKRLLGWTPRYASWREGFPEWVRSSSTEG
jgi:nucleoside-diphosphate-sugar epimerase